MAVTINIPSQVKTYANLAAFPASGSLKTIYIAEDTNKTYRWDGSTYVEISASAATGLTIGTTPISSGTIGRVLFQGTGNVLQQSGNLFWDSTNNRLGIGTDTPAFTFQTYRNTSAGYLASFNSGATLNTNASLTIRIENANLPSLQALNAGAGGFNTFALNPLGGNILIGTTTDAGFRLDVNGNTRINGDITAIRVVSSILRDGNNNAYINNSLINIATTNLAIGGTTVGEFTFTTKTSGGKYVFNNANVLINTTTDAGFRLDVNGNTRSSRFYATDGITVTRLSFDGFNNNTGIDYNSTTNLFRLFAAAGLNFLSAGFNLDTIIQPVRNTVDNIGDVVINVGGSERARFKAIGNIGFGTNAPNASSLLDLTSTTRGFLPPRMTTTQKNAIASPATGLQVYDTTLNRPCFYDGTTWITL
jgi:hypothetical protein